MISGRLVKSSPAAPMRAESATLIPVRSTTTIRPPPAAYPVSRVSIRGWVPASRSSSTTAATEVASRSRAANSASLSWSAKISPSGTTSTARTTAVIVR